MRYEIEWGNWIWRAGVTGEDVESRDLQNEELQIDIDQALPELKPSTSVMNRARLSTHSCQIWTHQLLSTAASETL